jgi:hypothetical protein
LISFDWDAENLAHIARHGVTAAEAEYVLTHLTFDLGFRTGMKRSVFLKPEQQQAAEFC